MLSYASGRRVLLNVEDEDADYVLLTTAVEEVGCEVRLFRVRHGLEALEFLRNTGTFTDAPRPDLILLDLNMPKMDGMQLLETLQEDASLAAIPVIVFTSTWSASEKAQCLALGARQFITKPLDYDIFLNTVKAMCAA